MLHAKYLGFHIGPEAHLHEWQAAVTKYHSRATNLLRVTDGLMAIVTLHNIQACPVLYYLAQLRDLPPHVPKMQDDLVELLTKGPYHWLPNEAPYNLDILFKLPTRFVRLRDVDVAVKVRTGSSPSLNWEDHYSRLNVLRWHEAQRWIPFAGAWLDRSAVSTLHRARQHFQVQVPGVPLRALPRYTQTSLHDMLRGAANPPTLEHLLCHRWGSRWLHLFRGHPLFGPAARRACTCMEAYAKKLPPFLVLAVVSAWFSGWCTAH